MLQIDATYSTAHRGTFLKCLLTPGSDHGPTIKHVTLLLHIPSHDLGALQLEYDHVLFLLHMLICSTGARLTLILVTTVPTVHVPVSYYRQSYSVL